jgi:hypothetical protein
MIFWQAEWPRRRPMNLTKSVSAVLVEMATLKPGGPRPAEIVQAHYAAESFRKRILKLHRRLQIPSALISPVEFNADG